MAWLNTEDVPGSSGNGRDKKLLLVLESGAHSNVSIQEAEADLFVNRASFRRARTTQRNPVSKNKQTKKLIYFCHSNSLVEKGTLMEIEEWLKGKLLCKIFLIP